MTLRRNPRKPVEKRLFLDLCYAVRGRLTRSRIPLDTTRLYWGDLRWWFNCPLCYRRVGKLYLPPRERDFACRHCHNLSYRSTQTYDKRVAFYKKNPLALQAAIKRGELLAIKAALEGE